MTNDRRAEKARLSQSLLSAGQRLLQWLAVTMGIFLWWMAVLLLFSLIFVNTWRISFDSIMKISLLLTGLCGAGYAGIMILRSKRG